MHTVLTFPSLFFSFCNYNCMITIINQSIDSNWTIIAAENGVCTINCRLVSAVLDPTVVAWLTVAVDIIPDTYSIVQYATLLFSQYGYRHSVISLSMETVEAGVEAASCEHRASYCVALVQPKIGKKDGTARSCVYVIFSLAGPFFDWIEFCSIASSCWRWCWCV